MAEAGVVLSEELLSVTDVIKEYKHVVLESCHKELVQLRIRHTDFKELTVKIQFPDDYPDSVLLFETKSSHISAGLLKRLENVCETELNNLIGKPQVLKVITFLSDFMLKNPFIVCSEEVQYVKKVIYREGDEMSVKPKSGSFNYKAAQGQYFLEFVITVPLEYPAEHVVLEFEDCNLPESLFQVIKGQSEELLRQCVQPPVRRKHSDPPFEPKPSLRRIFDFLLCENIRKYPLEECHICHKNALPSNPKNVVKEDSPDYIYRMYCGHLYHHKCLEVYMKTPPFEGGKRCASCNQRLFHDKWNTPPKLAEERWAHQEARKREIAEVAEFLGLD